ncbi:MAG: LPXTG cell wall anchor domain-containing protein, partial [Clostridia bacterium]|nr:LPXTG cell wall anchor domain-containing protein [Clostridia bacterium]
DTPGTGETASGITYSLALMLMAAYGGVYALRRRKGVFSED